MLEHEPTVETTDSALHGDHALLLALTRVLEEKQVIAPGEVGEMAQRIFTELMAENKRLYREKMEAKVKECLDELAKPDIKEQDRLFRQNLLAFYESELSK